MAKTKLKALRKDFAESNQKTAHFDLYKIKNSSSKVKMNLFPGDTGQAAQTDIFLEGVPADKGIIGKIEDYDLGSNNSLNAKYLDVYTAVTDVSGNTDLTSIEFNLSGGVQPYTYKLEKTVSQQGATIIYKMSIFFIKD